ncbi:MAG TPA: response regulator transcription factor [Verrucomicrobiae bacterium]|jgi:DNA-binding response OmpR family regulator|nr:response regulator transcription factor [Verrucomicrobiae bacterium]
MKLLIIEDDEGIVLALYRSLASLYKTDTATTAARGLQKISEQHYDIIILDLNLPDSTGLAVCEQVRASGLTTPILVLSGSDEVLSKVTLLDSGANDYLTKPFSIEELKARLRALLREPKSATNHHRLVVGDLVLDSVKHQVQRAGKPIKLSRKEFAVLECLMQHSGMVVTRANLSNYAWENNEDSLTNTVDVHIKYLRDKIDRPFVTTLIKTVHGLGYKIDAASDTSNMRST